MPRVRETLMSEPRLPETLTNPWTRERRNGGWLWVPKEDRFLKLSAKAKNVYVALAARARSEGEWACVKQSTISRDLGGMRGLRAALKELGYAGYLVIVPRYRRSAVYLLTDPGRVESELWGAHAHPRGEKLLGPLAKQVVGRRARSSLNTAPDRTNWK